MSIMKKQAVILFFLLVGFSTVTFAQVSTGVQVGFGVKSQYSLNLEQNFFLSPSWSVGYRVGWGGLMSNVKNDFREAHSWALPFDVRFSYHSPNQKHSFSLGHQYLTEFWYEKTNYTNTQGVNETMEYRGTNAYSSVLLGYEFQPKPQGIYFKLNLPFVYNSKELRGLWDMSPMPIFEFSVGWRLGKKK